MSIKEIQNDDYINKYAKKRIHIKQQSYRMPIGNGVCIY